MIELATGGVTARIDPARGARLSSLVVDGAEFLGGATPMDGDDPSFYSGCFPLAPFASTLVGSRFDWEGRTHLVGTGRGDRDHGTVHDVVWDVETASADRAVLHTSLGGDWPLPGGVALEYHLAPDRLETTLRLDARERMPAILGFHPWFRARVDGHDVALELPEPTVFDRDDHGRWRPRASAPPHPWDAVTRFTAPHATLAWGPRRLTIESPEARYWIVCETFAGAVCVEPLDGLPGSLGIGHWALPGGGDSMSEVLVTEAGQTRDLTMILRWS